MCICILLHNICCVVLCCECVVWCVRVVCVVCVVCVCVCCVCVVCVLCVVCVVCCTIIIRLYSKHHSWISTAFASTGCTVAILVYAKIFWGTPCGWSLRSYRARILIWEPGHFSMISASTMPPLELRTNLTRWPHWWFARPLRSRLSSDRKQGKRDPWWTGWWQQGPYSLSADASLTTSLTVLSWLRVGVERNQSFQASQVKLAGFKLFWVFFESLGFCELRKII